MRIFRMTALVVGLGTASACGSSSTPAAPTVAPTAAVSIPVGARTLGLASYVPNPITVSAGTVVTWTNTDAIAHTTTSDSGVFDSGIIAAGGKFSMTFSTKGSFPYHCTFHQGMVGTVVVQ